ncbi:MAG: N-acetylmuramoyl-L-alanine amidase [Dehalococcoidia bacterium]
MARNRGDTKLFLIHCSATKARQDIGLREINQWHEKRAIYSDRGLTGYHFVIRRDGTVELGRELREIGAHALGYNDTSVGICLVGGVKGKDLEPHDNFTSSQLVALEEVLRMLWLVWPEAHAIPHNLVAAKACPSFDVWTWLESTFNEDNRLAAMAVVNAIDGRS